MPSLIKSNKYLRTEEMRLKMATRTALNSSVIEGAEGIRGIRFGIKDGKIVALGESSWQSDVPTVRNPNGAKRC